MKDPKFGDDVRDVQNAYQREWRGRNKDKVREYNRRYWTKKAANSREKGGAADESTESAPGN